jgi:hypothetical protein
MKNSSAQTRSSGCGQPEIEQNIGVWNVVINQPPYVSHRGMYQVALKHTQTTLKVSEGFGHTNCVHGSAKGGYRRMHEFILVMRRGHVMTMRTLSCLWKQQKTDHASTHIKTIAVHRNRRMHQVFIKSNLTENVARTKSVIGRTEQQRHANRMMCRVPLAVEEWMSTRGDETVSGC